MASSWRSTTISSSLTAFERNRSTTNSRPRRRTRYAGEISTEPPAARTRQPAPFYAWVFGSSVNTRQRSVANLRTPHGSGRRNRDYATRLTRKSCALIEVQEASEVERQIGCRIEGRALVWRLSQSEMRFASPLYPLARIGRQTRG